MSQDVTVVEADFSHPLSKQEREELNALSVQAYGKHTRWQQLLRNGEYKVVTDVTRNGDPIQVKRLQHFTLNQIFSTMKKIVADNETAIAKAKEEAEKKRTDERVDANVKAAITEIESVEAASGTP